MTSSNDCPHTEAEAAISERSAGVDPSRPLIDVAREVNSLQGHMQRIASGALNEVGLSLVEFTVLDILEEQTNGHLRMQDIALIAGLTTGSATRLVNRLETRNLLRRVLCSEDRRGIYTELTQTGTELLAKARPLHDQAVQGVLGTASAAQMFIRLAKTIQGN